MIWECNSIITKKPQTSTACGRTNRTSIKKLNFAAKERLLIQGFISLPKAENPMLNTRNDKVFLCSKQPLWIRTCLHTTSKFRQKPSNALCIHFQQEIRPGATWFIDNASQRWCLRIKNNAHYTLNVTNILNKGCFCFGCNVGCVPFTRNLVLFFK